MNKDSLQKSVIELVEKERNVILAWSTGTGKGYTSVKTIEALRPKKTLIMVAESAHKDNWKEEFIKLGCEELLKGVTIDCYASLKKHINTSWNLIVFDEGHHLDTVKKIDIMRTLKSDRVLVLSATLGNNSTLLYYLEKTFGEFTTSSIGLMEAVNNGYLPTPNVFLIPMTLNSTDETETITEEWGIQSKRMTIKCSYKDRWKYLKLRKSIYPNATLIMSCTQEEKYRYYNEQFNYWQDRFFKTRNERVKNKWLQFGSKRKRMLGELKTKKVKKLLSKLKNKRYICFCTSIEQAKLLGGSNAIHSKNRDNDRIIQSFNAGDIDSIFAVGMLVEGQNLNNIQAGIIIQLDGVERPFIQKTGRVFRAKDPEQYIFYFKNTRDEEYLHNVLENIDSQYIKEIDF